MAAHLDTLTLTIAFGADAPVPASACPRVAYGRMSGASGTAMTALDLNAGEKHALVARCLR